MISGEMKIWKRMRLSRITSVNSFAKTTFQLIWHLQRRMHLARDVGSLCDAFRVRDVHRGVVILANTAQKELFQGGCAGALPQVWDGSRCGDNTAVDDG